MVIYCLWNAQFRKTAKNFALYVYICVRRGERGAALRLANIDVRFIHELLSGSNFCAPFVLMNDSTNHALSD